ncbi:hypothetical protein [Streptomyces sp. ISL-66]|uniref:hypothetical protein n=1 Tax=Streptomyces sp. ISL-66 TaxID=2819186 RepID=UPI002035F548|nr:hypothetical protein [Streptomyces sp. ISL-66]
MSWTSWTTRGVFAGRGGVKTDEAGPIIGEIDVHTTWTEADGKAHVTVQYSGASEWFTMSGSPVPCPSADGSRLLHDAVLEAVGAGGAATVPRSDVVS